ncbi:MULTISPECIES: SdpA family antimicrobial peptide system protein [Bacillus]|uniref:SdpA family antimicrobial peptide system protein n=1 Tax=Bacillus cereus VD048 TaxID=1053226 RepID=J8H0G6_BACCE|nr:MULTISPECIES: SdpA family antimicrobial peptide system protein [Bacillus cereus group]EJR26667.1 SdpA family antimicrobial peptide system protein [Bacillus cereus VD048]MBE7135328.1 SdpA family antimicrobial peptide system protein [Bacillus paranthracis]MBE7151917.1 SdpA family antimicrobial peptide system protein [Bacillus paranthracis]MCC2375558.1 SdpA family antimicrobial peptide system protein [Bacillus paranthracis]MCX3322842.1 SdpA family antimicrobial peptide system protein [Bacillus
MKKYPYLISFSMVTILLTILFTFALFNALPDSPIRKEEKGFNMAIQFMPQGWGFFSKSPRDETIFVHELQGSNHIQWPNNTAENLFGISRKGRGQGIELGLITSSLKKEDWITCDDGIKECKKKEKLNAIEVENSTPVPNVCGPYIVETREPVPWAWAKITDGENYPTKIVKVNVKCSKT